MKTNEVNKTVQTIAREIAQSPVSPSKYQRFSKQLDHAVVAIQVLESKNKTADIFAKTCTENMKEEVVKVSGALVNAWVNRQVFQIKKKSTLLKEGRLSLQGMKKLEILIQDFKKNHHPSIPHRRDIADAERALLQVRDGTLSKRHFNVLVEKIEVLPGEVEDLLDIAKAVYHRDFSQAKRLYATLPSDHKLRFEKHMQNLMAKPFVDALETMQAMIATVNELVENGEGYPSSDKIDQLFIGLSQVTAEERAEGKISSFLPRASFGG